MKACFLQAYIVHVWSFAASWLHFICGCAVESGHAMKRKVSTEREEKADAGGKPKCKGTNMIKVSSRSHAWSKTVRHIWDEAARQSDTYETKMRSHRTKQNVKDEAAAGVPTYTTQISGYCTRTKYCNQIRTSDVAPLHCKMLGGRALFVQRWLIQCWFIVCFVMLPRVVRSMLVCPMLVNVGSLNVALCPRKRWFS